jgi:DNA-binding transcriptional regulator YhcF (GntR family)
MKEQFIQILGDNSKTRLLEFLIVGRDFDYCLSEMAEKANISWTSLHRVFPEFEKNKIVVKSRDIGRAKLYKINKENLFAKKMIELYDSLLLSNLEKNQEKQVIKAMIK